MTNKLTKLIDELQTEVNRLKVENKKLSSTTVVEKEAYFNFKLIKPRYIMRMINPVGKEVTVISLHKADYCNAVYTDCYELTCSMETHSKLVEDFKKYLDENK
jgi:hypothetical protein